MVEARRACAEGLRLRMRIVVERGAVHAATAVVARALDRRALLKVERRWVHAPTMRACMVQAARKVHRPAQLRRRWRVHVDPVRRYFLHRHNTYSVSQTIDN